MPFVSTAAWGVLPVVLMLGIVVVFHEFGHFLAAKLIGVQVDVFSFGFGPRLFGRRIGETDYRVSLIPLGGYVRMLGDGAEERTGSPREFDSRRSWEKLLIMFMGPVFNLIMAIGVVAITLVIGYEIPAYLRAPVRVEYVEPDSPAETAGIRPGDVITAVDGGVVRDWESFNDVVMVNPRASLRLSIDRGGAPEDVTLRVAERTKHAIGHAGVYPCFRVIAESVNVGSPAARAGIRAGDALLAVGSQPVCTAGSVAAALQAARGAPVTLTLQRAGERLTVEVEPKWSVQKKWIIGVTQQQDEGEMILEKLGPAQAITGSLARNWHNTRLIGATLARLLTGRLSFRTMSGPLELASVAKETARIGIVPFLQLMGFISLNLAIFNLIPVPLLDGGRIAILLVEAVRRREMEQHTKERLLQLGFLMIVVLVLVVVYFDLLKLGES